MLENDVILLLAYLLGSIPFGLLLTRWAGLGDLRGIGSGNIGATNVLRTGNKKLAALTLLLDGGKGAVAVLMAAHFWPDSSYHVGIAAVLGHVYPVWLNFKGGKGVATTLGVMLAWSWPIGLALLAIWLVVAFLFRYSSLGALAALSASPILFFVSLQPAVAPYALMLALLVIYLHRENIQRLWHGTEPKIGANKKATPPHAPEVPPP
jgi:glycerol-3-phosphate acyltransferase PlsY